MDICLDTPDKAFLKKQNAMSSLSILLTNQFEWQPYYLSQ